MADSARSAGDRWTRESDDVICRLSGRQQRDPRRHRAPGPHRKPHQRSRWRQPRARRDRCLVRRHRRPDRAQPDRRPARRPAVRALPPRPDRARHPRAQPRGYRAPGRDAGAGAAVPPRGRQGVWAGHLRHEGRSGPGHRRLPAAGARQDQPAVADHLPVQSGRGGGQRGLAPLHRGRSRAQSLRAGDRAQAQRRQDRHATQGDGALPHPRARAARTFGRQPREGPQRHPRHGRHHPADRRLHRLCARHHHQRRSWSTAEPPST